MLQSLISQSVSDHPLRALEAGSGCGIISIMLSLQKPQWDITALEIHPDLCALSISNAKQNEVSIRLLNQDLRLFDDLAGFDLIYSNPPWQKLGSGLLSPQTERNLGRHELFCTMEDILLLVNRCLKPAASAFLIYPSQRLKDMEKEIRKTSLDILHKFYVPDSKRYIVFELTV